jgi:hypothetical protein
VIRSAEDGHLAQKETPHSVLLDQWNPLLQRLADGTLWEIASNEKYLQRSQQKDELQLLGNPEDGEPGNIG